MIGKGECCHTVGNGENLSLCLTPAMNATNLVFCQPCLSTMPCQCYINYACSSSIICMYIRVTKWSTALTCHTMSEVPSLWQYRACRVCALLESSSVVEKKPGLQKCKIDKIQIWKCEKCKLITSYWQNQVWKYAKLKENASWKCKLIIIDNIQVWNYAKYKKMKVCKIMNLTLQNATSYKWFDPSGPP